MEGIFTLEKLTNAFFHPENLLVNIYQHTSALSSPPPQYPYEDPQKCRQFQDPRGEAWGAVFGYNLPELHILPCVGLIRLLHMGEFKVEGLRLCNFSRPGQVLHQGYKFMVVPAVVVEFWRESISLLYQTPSYSGPSKGLQDVGTPLL